MAGLSAVLSATDVGSFGGMLARLAAPMVAAWLWERGLSIERRRSGRSTIHWRITPERILVRLGLAEATERTTGDVDAHRRLTHLARSAMKVRTLRAAGVRAWRTRRAGRRLNTAMADAVEYAALAADTGRQRALLAQLGALYHVDALAELAPPAPWTHLLDGAQDSSVLDTVRTERGRTVRTDGGVQPRTDRTGRVRTRPDIRADVNRNALVAELTADILAAAAAGEKWQPDYDLLMKRTRAGKSWCEKVVRDAKLYTEPASRDASGYGRAPYGRRARCRRFSRAE
jgi:hypothetical protein